LHFTIHFNVYPYKRVADPQHERGDGAREEAGLRSLALLMLNKAIKDGRSIFSNDLKLSGC
jgi:hypothetical protein